MQNLKFSIVIAAKNEEENISLLMYALDQLDYPCELYEVIIIDDNSGDDTYKIASSLSQKIENYTVIKAENKPYPAKKGALAVGIARAQHPYIMITDADCAPRADWLKAYADKFAQGYDIAFGIAPYLRQENLVNELACFENLRAHMLTFAFAKMGMPYSASARNFGFKKSSFEQIGGYGNTTETLSGDDDLLIREAVKNGLKIGTVTAPNSFVYSRTAQTWKEYFRQKARHVSTSSHYLFKHKLMLGLWHLVNIASVLLVPFAVVNIYFLLPFAIKIIFDMVSVNSSQKKYDHTFSLLRVIPLQTVYEVLHIVHFVNSLFSKNKWK